MNEQTFRLLPFEAAMAGSALRLAGGIRREGSVLCLRYELSGPTACLVIPAAVPSPQRRDALWHHTCLECFLAVAGHSRYWEVNLSPCGDWNVYRLSGYRTDLAPETAFRALPFVVERGEGKLRLEVRLDLTAIVAPSDRLELAICAVLEGSDGSLSHWALAHGAAAPDFHRREDFLLHL
jgi:hypothetical protein